MIDALRTLALLLVAGVSVALAIYGCIRLQKRREMRHAKEMQARQWAERTAQRQWLTEQQQRRQHSRTIRGNNN